jgi:hypothetical protein
MHFMRIIAGVVIAVFAILASVITTAAVALFVAIRRALKPIKRAQVMPPSPRRATSRDVIDIIATEVPADSPSR